MSIDLERRAPGRVSPAGRISYRSSCRLAAYFFAPAATTFVTESASTVALFDGLFRPRQSQTYSVAGGRVLSDTFYDTRGWVSKTNNRYWDPTTTPSTTAVTPNADNTVPDQTISAYDGLGRATTVGSYAYGALKWSTGTVYGGDRVTVTPPRGATPTTTISDARGRTVELDQYTDGTTTSTPQATTYTYDALGHLARTVSAGRTWTDRHTA